MSSDPTGQLAGLDALAMELPPDLTSMLERWRSARLEWKGPVRIDSPADIAGLIDHTILKPTATQADVRKVCAEAVRWRFKSVCVNPCHVPLVAGLLDGTGVLCCSVVGFPLGACTTGIKAAETAGAVKSGAAEVDMVIDQGRTLAGDWTAVASDIGAVVAAADGRTVKVIIETCNLDGVAKVGACLCSALSGAAFVKTSTGFGTAGATKEDIALMRLVVGGGMSVKASGGIRTTQDALSMIDAGADRIGASASIAIIGA